MSTSHIVIRPPKDGEKHAVSVQIDGKELANDVLVDGFSIVPAVDAPGHFRVTLAFEGTLDFEDTAAEVVES